MGLVSRLRRRKLPELAVRAFDPAERIVAWASLRFGGYLVATNIGLWLPDHAERLGWPQVSWVTWSAAERMFTVIPSHLARAAGTAPDAPVDVYDNSEPLSYPLDDAADFPHQVQVKIIRSLAYSNHFKLPDGGVQIMARPAPDGEGLSWSLRYDKGTTVNDADHDLLAQFLAQAHAATPAY